MLMRRIVADGLVPKTFAGPNDQPVIFCYASNLSVAGRSTYGSPIPPDVRELPELLRPFVDALWGTNVDSDQHSCPYCSARLVQLPHDRFLMKNRLNLEKPVAFGACGTCGFWYVESHFQGLVHAIDITYHIAALKSFSINDPELALTHLLHHISGHVSDINTISPRRFEELVAQVYRDLAYSVRLTQQSRDGGYDLVLLERTGYDQGRGDSQIIVECKRYAQDRNITVGIVRQLLGVQLELGVKRAKIVASTRFSQPAIQSAQKVSNGHSGYELELVDIQRLAEMLRVYSNRSMNLDDDPRFPKTRRDVGITEI